MWFLELLWDGVVAIIGLIARAIGVLIGVAIVLVVSAIQSAISGAILASIGYLLALAFGHDPVWVNFFQFCFWMLFIITALYGTYKFVVD